jgi:tripeptidyl-peptidase-2
LRKNFRVLKWIFCCVIHASRKDFRKKKIKMDFHGLLPKKETQSLQFSKSYDGTGVVIAILDTGVDPAAPGLATTTTGLNKITHIIDCTGTGDVCGTMVVIDNNRSVIGLSGKELKLGDWTIKDNKIYLGLKVADDLFPKALVERLSKVKTFLII